MGQLLGGIVREKRIENSSQILRDSSVSWRAMIDITAKIRNSIRDIRVATQGCTYKNYLDVKIRKSKSKDVSGDPRLRH